MINLTLDLWGVNEHAQKVMKKLGITYSLAVPQSLGDSWWFFNCKNIPNPLPKYLKVLTVDYHKCVGYGLAEEDVEMLDNEEKVSDKE